MDLMNEPDAYGATWTDGGTLPEDVATYYLDAMDALYPLCPGCLFQIQGCGEPVHLSLPAMRLCEHDTSLGEVRGRHANAVPLRSPSPSLSAGMMGAQKALDQMNCGKSVLLPLPLPSNMHCVSKAVLSSVALRPCKHAPVIADLLN